MRMTRIDFMGGGGGGRGGGEGGGGGGGDAELWYVVCRNDRVLAIQYGDPRTDEVLAEPFYSKRDALEWIDKNIPTREC